MQRDNSLELSGRYEESMADARIRVLGTALSNLENLTIESVEVKENLVTPQEVIATESSNFVGLGRVDQARASLAEIFKNAA